MSGGSRDAVAIALLGDAFVDVQVDGLSQLPAWGVDRACSSVRMLAGGSCANTARQLASLGGGAAKVCFFSAVGDDEFGRFYRRELASEGALACAETTLVTLPGTPQSTCVVLSGPADRAMVSCYSSVGRMALSPFRECSPALAGGSAPWRHLHIGGYFNIAGCHTEALLALVAEVRAQGGTVSLDPQYDTTERWVGADGRLGALLGCIDVFMPNEAEACGVAGTATAAEALESLASAHPALLVVLKRGADGVVAARGPTERWAAAALPVDVVDVTGAGDAFDAGFLLELLLPRHDVGARRPWAWDAVDAALASGAAAGAVCVGVAGACERPMRRDELAAARG